MSRSSPEAKSELQVAIVTEGTGGIGLGAAIVLADWGFEVLARWRHPERGDVGPDVFIPIVEKLSKLSSW